MCWLLEALGGAGLLCDKRCCRPEVRDAGTSGVRDDEWSVMREWEEC